MHLIEANRVRHTCRQTLKAAPEDVFPLLCPVREMEWARDREPLWVRSSCGLVETDCIFKTRSKRGDTTWVVSRHEPQSFELEMIMLTPGHTVGRLEIALQRNGETGCLADIACGYTSLGPDGDRYLQGFTAEKYIAFMRNRERELNHYLATGEKLKD